MELLVALDDTVLVFAAVLLDVTDDSESLVVVLLDESLV